MEAAAFGLPIISTPAGGLDEQVVWNRSALRFDFGDSDRLAEHLLKLLQNPALRREMGLQGRAAFDLRLDAEGMLDRYQRAIISAAGIKCSGESKRKSAPLVRVA